MKSMQTIRGIAGLSVKSLSLAAFGFLVSCAGEPEKKPVGPTSDTSRISWNSQVPGQGMGQLGMMPQNQYRR